MSKKGSSGPLSKEDVHFAVFVGLIVTTVVFSLLSVRVWFAEPARVDPKLTKAQQQALAQAWIPFTFAAWNDGQLGATLLALAGISFSALTWKKDKARALVPAAVFFLVYPILEGLSLWMPFSLIASGLLAYGALIYAAPSGIGRTDVVQSAHAVTARVLFVVDSALLVYAEVLRLQSPDYPVTTTEGLTTAPASVDPVQHRAARLALAIGFLVVTIGADVHAYRGLLKTGIWVWVAALCPCLGVYSGGSSRGVLVVISSVLILAHAVVHCTFPFNMPVIQFYRRWQSDMNRVVRGAGEE